MNKCQYSPHKSTYMFLFVSRRTQCSFHYTSKSASKPNKLYFSLYIPKQKYSFLFNESKRLFTAQKLQFPSTDIIIYMAPASMSEMASYKRLLNACCKHWVAERGTGTRTKKFGRWVFFIRFFDRNVKRLS